MGKIVKNNLADFLVILLIFILAMGWIFSGWPQIWKNPPIPSEVQEVKANTTNLLVTSCDVNDVADSTCYDAISADGGTSYALTKGAHIDAPFQTLSAQTVTSATLYYDSWATLSFTWGIYVKDARDGTTICSVDPAPEDASETNNSIDCSSITTTQLSNGVWLYVINNDDKAPDDVNLDYVRLYVDYTPAAIVSVSVSDGVVTYGTLGQNSTKSTHSGDLGDLQTATNDGDVTEDFNIKGQNSGNWTLGATAGSDIYVHQFCTASCTTPPTNYTALTTGYQTLATGIAPTNNQTFDLYINTPDPSTVFTEQSVNVTIQAVESL